MERASGLKTSGNYHLWSKAWLTGPPGPGPVQLPADIAGHVG